MVKIGKNFTRYSHDHRIEFGVYGANIPVHNSQLTIIAITAVFNDFLE